MIMSRSVSNQDHDGQPRAGHHRFYSCIRPVLAQDADPSAMANLVIQVQELQDEVRNLRGQLEEQARELENLKRRQRDQYLDLDQRCPTCAMPSR